MLVSMQGEKLDYAKLGLKCGLEIHQQLDTGKLFCRCPSALREDKPDFTFRRMLHPVPSELGEYDPAALEAFGKGLQYVYEAYKGTTCLVEADEEPPMEMNKEALKTTLQVALMLGSKISDEIVVMRKTVIDGSNTSGFQRTALIATGGRVSCGKGSIGIQTIVIEEDAARPMKKTDKEIFYRLDRLGIPLIEIATAPEITSPEQAQEAALAIGSILRLTGKAKRGLGTIRQDLNISIAKGARVEIKGVQELELIGEYVKREAMRQAALLELQAELQSRGLKESEIKAAGKAAGAAVVDASKVLKGTECKMVAEGLAKQGIAMATKLPKFKGLLGKELQPGRRFGTEIADYLKAKAGIAGLFHSDELPKYGISAADVNKIAEMLNLEENDAFGLIVAEKREKAEFGLAVIAERCKQALKGIPEETRNALGDGNTAYSRPLPGAARMYPETDLGSIPITRQLTEDAKSSLPKGAEERKKLYMSRYRISEKLAEKMKLSNYAPLFEKFASKGYDATTAAALLLEGLVKLRREGIETEKISDEMIEAALESLKQGRITKDVLLGVLAEWSRKPTAELGEVVSMMGIAKAASAEIEKIVARIASENEKLIKAQRERAFSALMGLAMKELHGKASGEAVGKLVKKEIEKKLRE